MQAKELKTASCNLINGSHSIEGSQLTTYSKVPTIPNRSASHRRTNNTEALRHRKSRENTKLTLQTDHTATEQTDVKGLTTTVTR